MVQLIYVATQLFVLVQLMHEILWYCIVGSSGNWHIVGSHFIQNVCHLQFHAGYVNHCKYFGNKLASQNETHLHNFISQKCKDQ